MDEESGSASIFRLDLRYRYRQYRIDLPILRPVALSRRVMQSRFSAPKAAPIFRFLDHQNEQKPSRLRMSLSKFNRLGVDVVFGLPGDGINV